MEIVGKGKPVGNIKIHFKISGKETTTQSTILNAFSSYFVQVGYQLAGIVFNFDDPLSYVKSSLHTMFIPYITENEIIEVSKSLKNKSPDWDSIPANIAKPSI